MCRNYEKDYDVPKSSNTLTSSQKVATVGMAAGGFFGLLIAMLLLGAALGVTLFIGLAKYRGGQSMTSTETDIKFERSRDDA